MATLEELLAEADLSASAQPTAPMPTYLNARPQYETPISLLGFLGTTGRAAREGITEGLASYPKLISALPGLGKAAVSPETYKSLASYITEQPLAAIEQTARGVGSTAMRVAGGGAGLIAAAPVAAEAALTGNLYGAAALGLGGASAGQAAGGLAWNKALQLIGADKATTPEQDWSQFVKEATGAAVTGGVEKAAVVGLPKAITKTANVIESNAQEIGRKIAPATKPEINEQVAKTLQELGVDKQTLAKQIKDNEAIANPMDKNPTLAELTGNPDVAIAEGIVQKSPGGARPMALQERAQVAEIEKQLKDIYIGETQGPVSALTPDQAAIGDKLQAQLTKMRTDATLAGNAMYEQIPDVKISTTDLKHELTKAGEELWNEAKGPRLSSRLDYVLRYLKQEEPAVPYATSKLLPTETTSKKLISARSALLEESRKLAAAGNLDEAKLAGDAAELVNKKLLNDETRFAKDPNIPKEVSDRFKAANDNWKELHDTYNRGFLVNLADANTISPDNVIAHVTANVGSWRQFLKQVNNDPEAIKDILSAKFDEFSKLGTVEAKLKWVKENREMFRNSPMDDTLANAEKALKNVETVYKKKQLLAQEQVGKGGDKLDINTLSNLSDVSRMGLTGSTYANAANRTIQAGVTQFTRDKIRQAVGLGLSTALGGAAVGYGLPGMLTSAIAAAPILAGTAAIAKRKQGHLQQLNETLANALRDPKEALKAFEDLGAADKARGALKEKYAAKQAEISKRIPLTTGEQLLTGLVAPQVEGEPTQFPTEIKVEPSTKAITAAPTAAPEPSKLESLLSSVGDLIVPPAEAETRKPTAVQNKVAAAAERLRARGASPEAKKSLLNLRPAINKNKEEFKIKVDWSKHKNISESKKKQFQDAFNLKKDELRAKINKYNPPEKIKALIAKEDNLTKAQMFVESTWDHSAISNKGAIGLMQIMPDTAFWLGINPFIPEANIAAGKKYRDQLINKYKDRDLGLAAYNAGPGTIDKLLKKLESKRLPKTYLSLARYDYLPKETEDYVSRIKTVYKQLSR